jgi:hypothetical protein
MRPAPSYEDICAHLGMYLRESPGSVRMVGLVFARPEASIAKSEIYPSLPYFHFRSGRAMNFYFAGFEMLDGRDPRRRTVISDPDPESARDWFFLAESFNTLREDIERRTRWRYSGGSDLVLTGDLARALGSISASVLYMPCETDLYFTKADIVAESRLIPHVTVVTIPSLWGHAAGAGRNEQTPLSSTGRSGSSCGGAEGVPTGRMGRMLAREVMGGNL